MTDASIFEFLQSHSSVIYQPPFDSPHYSSINPYTLGFNMMMDIRRICDNPTEEDRHWFPDIAGSDWKETLQFAMRNFKDESFILQYLSPKIIRDLKLFAVVDDDREAHVEVNAIHDEEGYMAVRQSLAGLYNLGNREPNIQAHSVDIRGDRSLTLHHTRHSRKPLDNSAQEVIRHLHRLWGFDVHLHSMEGDKIQQSFHWPPRPEE